MGCSIGASIYTFIDVRKKPYIFGLFTYFYDFLPIFTYFYSHEVLH